MRDMSLLEQKKLQWAKEKEELSKLNDFFSATTTTQQFERTSIRTYYSNVDESSSTNSMVKSNTIPRRTNYYHEQFELPHQYYKSNKKLIDPRHGSCRAYAVDSCCDNDSQNTENLDINHATNRAPLLPPIGRNSRQKQMSTQTRQNHFMHQNTDEETSGYLSDRMSPLMWPNQMSHPTQSQHQHLPKDYSNYIYPSSGDELAPEMNAMNIEERERRRIPKHKPAPTRDHINGHETDFTMPKTPSSMCSESQNYSRFSSSCAPSRKEKEERAKWVDRNNHVYDSVSKESSIKSDGPCWLERGFVDSGDESVRSYSFIRGQNAPIDPLLLAERTSKRMKALELQNAIKAQVEERECLRKMELEKCRLEERRQEEKLRQQLESNEQRFEEEQRKTREKLEREQRKQEIMRMAIEKARQEAEIEKARRKRPICMSDDAPEDEQIDDVYEDVTTTRAVAATATAVPQSPSPTDIATDTDTDDGEKILIGTPIKMRKKTLNKPCKVTVSATKKEASVQSERETITGTETNVDGIALVLQTLPPIMPILSNDIINLNQNINTLNTNNIQLAVMLAQQMQQLSSIAQNQKPDSAANKSNGVTNTIDEKPVSSSQNTNDKESMASDVCKQCTTTWINGKSSTQMQEMMSSSDDQLKMRDAATVTDDFDALLPVQIKSSESIDAKPNYEMSDASTQTDKKLEYCFQCQYDHCHHHHIIREFPPNSADDMKTMTVNHINTKIKCTDKECASASVMVSRNMYGESREPIKIEDRPKWGVNRPLHQYVKASERDPFYLRNKRKKSHQKRQCTDEQNPCCDNDTSKDDSTPESRSISPSPSIITNSTVTLSSPQLKNRKRSICTEILPIQTDGNGRVYLNFNGASLQVTEDERPSSKRPQKIYRMMHRSQTANDIQIVDSEQFKITDEK